MDYNLDEFVPKFEIISDGASKEAALEKRLNAMEEEWNDLYFTLIPHRLIELLLFMVVLKKILQRSFIFLEIRVLIYYLV